MERTTRSRIFETILKDSSNGAAAPKPRPAPPSMVVPATVAPAPAPSPGAAPSPNEFELSRDRARRAEDHGDHQTAASEYLRAIVTGGGPQVSQMERIDLFLSLGRCQQRRQRFAEARLALQHAQQVIDASDAPAQLNCQQVEVDAYIGSLEFAQGDVSKAEAHLISAINRYEESCIVDPKRLARLYVTLSSIYTEASLYGNAMELALKGLTFLAQCTEDVNWEKMRMYQLLATIACKKSEKETAVGHLLDAYHFAGLLASQQDLIELEVLLATVYAHYGQDREACAWCEAAIRRQEVTGEQAEWPLSLLYLCLGQLQARSAPEMAAPTFHRSLDLQLSHLYLNPTP